MKGSFARARRLWSLAAAGGVVVALVSGCAAGGSSFEATQEQLVGTWTNKAGVKLVLARDGSFGTERIEQASTVRGGCAEVLKSGGKWLLFGKNRSGLSTSDPKGSTFNLQPVDLRANLACELSVAVQKDDEGINLCVVEDLDQVCAGGDLLRKDG